MQNRYFAFRLDGVTMALEKWVKVLMIFDTRPEAIKLAPAIRELQRRSMDSRLQTIVRVTAQHRHMLDQVLRLFGIVPDYDLDLIPVDKYMQYCDQRSEICLGGNKSWEGFA